MRFFISPTDYDWYSFLSDKQYDEVNFWRPGARAFTALSPGDLFVFKLKKPYNAIVGGGFFTSYSLAPIDLVWNAFGEKNGTATEQQFLDRLADYRRRNSISLDYPTVGCILLANPFFLQRNDWIQVPSNWVGSIVAGKLYNSQDNAEGQRVFNDLLLKLKTSETLFTSHNEQMQYGLGLAKYRLGQGTFRLMIADTYSRKCAISGEKTLPVLDAAHIIPFSASGENTISNGILLRSDLHTLFDAGYITITETYHVEVSKRIREDFGNGRDYYKHHGSSLVSLPRELWKVPSKENLQWHNNKIFLG